MARDREAGRGERVLPGLHRLRLPLPIEGVPHCNAWAVACDGGIVLFDTGMYHEGSLADLERAMSDVGLTLEQVRLTVITHAHPDHWGQAGPVRDRSGCAVWINPNVAHAIGGLEDPESALERRLEIGRLAGVSEAALERFAERIRGSGSGVAEIVEPDRHLVDGVIVDTDLGPWRVYETPGHAPSHVCLHQPERRLLISGDHLLGRPSLYFDYGFTPDPIGEYLHSLEVIEPLDARLCMSGHGRTFTNVLGHITAHRELVDSKLRAVRDALTIAPATALELVRTIYGGELTPALTTWRLTETLCYLRHLQEVGAADSEGDGAVQRWRPVPAPGTLSQP